MKTKILITLAALIAAAAGASDFQCSTNSQGQVTLEAYTPSEESKLVMVPQYVDKIGTGAFQNRLGVETVYLPDKVSQIGVCAFYGASSLKHVRMPQHLNEIHNLAFSRCTSLESILIPSTCTLFGDQIFDGTLLNPWRPWIAWQNLEDSLTLIYEGTLQSSPNFTDWLIIKPTLPGLENVVTINKQKYYRAINDYEQN